MTLSAVVITHNESDAIERCLKSLAFCDEVVVVDSFSTDDTLQKAQALGATTFTRKWSGYGDQKNFGLSKATSDWVLFIDADEEVSPTLANQIQQVVKSARRLQTANCKLQANYYWLRITTIFLGKPLNHLYGHNLRLFRRNAATWTNDQVHEQVQTTAGKRLSLGDRNTSRIAAPLTHHSHSTIKSYLATMHQYATLDAEQMMHTGHHRSGRTITSSSLLPFKLALRQFIKLLIYRRGIFDGIPGIIWCTLSAYYEFEMANKYNAKVKSQKSKL